MADKSISELPVARQLDDDSLFAVAQQGEARSVEGRLFKQFAREGVSQYVEAAEKAAADATEAAGKVQGSVDSAVNAAAAAEKSAGEAAKSVTAIGTAVEDAQGAAQAAEKSRKAIEDMTVGAETLPAGGEATVTKVERDGVVHMQFGIPQGEKGADSTVPGPAGVSPTVEVSRSGKTTTVTITDAQGPHAFDIKDGADGSGTGDMVKETYDPQGKAEDIFAYADKLAEGKQDALKGTLGQVVGFDGNGKAVAAEVGGANLYTGTKDFSGTWRNNSDWHSDGEYKGFTVKATEKTHGKNPDGLSQTLKALAGDTYVISAYIKADASATIKCWTGKGGVSDTTSPTGIVMQIGTEWNRYAVPFTVLSDCEIEPRFDAADNVMVYACGIKLERGSIATDWSPAPEDKQDTLTGQQGQVVGFDENGRAVPQEAGITEEEADRKYLLQTGGTVTGPLSVPEPTETAHAATKGYVDKLVGDIGAILDDINGEEG